jgi:hypothetical protein
LVNNTPDFLQSTELGLLSMYTENQALRSRIAELDARVTELEPLHSLNISQRDTITSQRDTITTLKILVDNNNTLRTNVHRKKRQSADPDKFSGKGSPTERQQDFETWIVKIESVFARDLDHFENVQSQILYISDMLTGKAYEYIKDGIHQMIRNNDEATRWQWEDRKSLLEHLSTHYITLDTSQVAKNKLDDFPQNDRNYWSWKADLDETMIRAKKTDEQKVDLLRKFVSARMKDLVLTLQESIPDDAYSRWSKQMDTFARNLANRAHQDSLEKKTAPPVQNYKPRTPQGPVAPASIGEPMELDRLSDQERQRRVDNKLCLACGQPGHWKDAHDPMKAKNPIPMPPRQQPTLRRGQYPFDNNRGNFRGHAGYPGQGRGTYHTRQPYVPNQWQVRVGDYEPGYVVGEESSHAPTDSDTISQSSRTQNLSRQQSPVHQLLKDQPLN